MPMGSALGVYRIAKTLKKDAYITVNKEQPSIKTFVECLPEQYNEVLINKEKALDMIDADTLLVVVDTHKKIICRATRIIR